MTAGLTTVFSVDGKWILFTGDQVGAILASRCFEKYLDQGKPLGMLVIRSRLIALLIFCNTGNLAMVASTVSSKFLRVMAEREGFKFVETLTG